MVGIALQMTKVGSFRWTTLDKLLHTTFYGLCNRIDSHLRLGCLCSLRPNLLWNIKKALNLCILALNLLLKPFLGNILLLRIKYTCITATKNTRPKKETPLIGFRFVDMHRGVCIKTWLSGTNVRSISSATSLLSIRAIAQIAHPLLVKPKSVWDLSRKIIYIR